MWTQFYSTKRIISPPNVYLKALAYESNPLFPEWYSPMSLMGFVSCLWSLARLCFSPFLLLLWLPCAWSYAGVVPTMNVMNLKKHRAFFEKSSQANVGFSCVFTGSHTSCLKYANNCLHALCTLLTSHYQQVPCWVSHQDSRIWKLSVILSKNILWPYLKTNCMYFQWCYQVLGAHNLMFSCQLGSYLCRKMIMPLLICIQTENSTAGGCVFQWHFV